MEKLFGLIPFVMMVNGKPRLNYMRILELVIIAVLTAFATSQLTVARMEVKLEHLTESHQQQVVLFDKVCDKLERLSEKVIKIDTLQQQRLEKERRLGR